MFGKKGKPSKSTVSSSNRGNLICDQLGLKCSPDRYGDCVRCGVQCEADETTDARQQSPKNAAMDAELRRIAGGR